MRFDGTRLLSLVTNLLISLSKSYTFGANFYRLVEYVSHTAVVDADYDKHYRAADKGYPHAEGYWFLVFFNESYRFSHG